MIRLSPSRNTPSETESTLGFSDARFSFLPVSIIQVPSNGLCERASVERKHSARSRRDVTFIRQPLIQCFGPARLSGFYTRESSVAPIERQLAGHPDFTQNARLPGCVVTIDGRRRSECAGQRARRYTHS